MAGSMGSNDLPVMGFFKRIFLLDMAINMGVLWNLGYATTISSYIPLISWSNLLWNRRKTEYPGIRSGNGTSPFSSMIFPAN